jgi:hypothetical protein
MKKYIVTLLVSVLAVTAAFANSVTITWENNHSPTGGEFVMTPSVGLPFNTFCLEMNQYITVGNTYSYTIGNSTDGGVSGGPDPISIGTAWLYSNFRNGTLNGFTGTEQQQEQLQNSFWYLENETTDSSATGNYISLTQAALPSVNLFSDANGAYGVDVWNLFDNSGAQCQSQLGIERVPDGGSTLLLGFIGCFAVVGFRKFSIA